jgi:hypothetical protein
MKIAYKGLFRDDSQLPIGVLPENATRIKAPVSLHKFIAASTITFIPAGLLIALFVLGSYLLHGGLSSVGFNGWGLMWYFLICIPHEILHAICFGKGAEAELYARPPAWIIVCTQPLSKMRFILMCMLPNLVFGWIPLLIWMLLPYYGGVSHLLFTVSVFGILLGGGDYMNVFNTLHQQPNGSMQQISGSNSYWFTPNEENKVI